MKLPNHIIFLEFYTAHKYVLRIYDRDFVLNRTFSHITASRNSTARCLFAHFFIVFLTAVARKAHDRKLIPHLVNNHIVATVHRLIQDYDIVYVGRIVSDSFKSTSDLILNHGYRMNRRKKVEIVSN